jgi:hypothetical protein
MLTTVLLLASRIGIASGLLTMIGTSTPQHYLIMGLMAVVTWTAGCDQPVNTNTPTELGILYHRAEGDGWGVHVMVILRDAAGKATTGTGLLQVTVMDVHKHDTRKTREVYRRTMVLTPEYFTWTGRDDRPLPRGILVYKVGRIDGVPPRDVRDIDFSPVKTEITATFTPKTGTAGLVLTHTAMVVDY